MEYIKNKTAADLELLGLGITLSADEDRDIAEFANRGVLQDNASYLNELVYNDKIRILDADRNELSKVECVQYISNAYSKVVVELDKTSENDKWYFVKDEFRVKKNEVVKKSFLGNVESLYVYTSSANIDALVKLNGLVMPVEELVKRQTFELELKGKAKDLELEITGRGTTNVDVYIDGYTTASVVEVQEFIDNWRE
jgi:hypothetical protein